MFEQIHRDNVCPRSWVNNLHSFCYAEHIDEWLRVGYEIQDMHFVKSEELKNPALRSDVVAAAARFMGANPEEPVPSEALLEEKNKHDRGQTTEEWHQCYAALSKPDGYLAACNRHLVELTKNQKWMW
eukprot:FR736104.1.p2 GENE.FR736104.1~~FR736104.1.p2  ORF type:complete len:128 (+),score=14.58 FR736104.1:220-603(+)